jgi:hypothetical protein
VTLGPIAARPGRTLARREAELQRAAEAAYEERLERQQISAVARNTGIGEQTLSDLFGQVFLKEHELAAGPNLTKSSRFEADTEIARLWQKARSGPLEGSDLTISGHYGLRGCGDAADEGRLALSIRIGRSVV